MLGGLRAVTLATLVGASGCAELLDIDTWATGGGAGAGVTQGGGGGDAPGGAGASTSSTGRSGGGTGGGGGTAGGGGGGCPSGPAPAVPLACGQAKPSAVLALGGVVYWANEGDGAIRKVLLVGGSVEEIAAPGPGSPCALAATTSHLVWRTREGEIWRWPFLGGAPDVMFMGQTELCALAADTTDVYWPTFDPMSSNGAIRRSSTTAPVAIDVVTVTKTGGPIAVDAADVYWGHNGTDVYRAEKGQLNLVTAFTSAGNACGLILGANDVFWTEANGGNVAVLAKNGIPSDKFYLAQGEQAPCAIASAPPLVLWTSGAGGEVRRANAMVPGADSLAAGLANPCAIATHGMTVVWTTCDDGAVWKAPTDASAITIEEGTGRRR